jgi:ubiquinone biosynthesis protein COQ4
MARPNRIRPLAAWRALRALIQNPDDTAQAFCVIAALSGNSSGRLYRRFRRSPDGARLLAERPDLHVALADLPGLLAQPEGSLGRAIGDFFSREQISSDGLQDASLDAGRMLGGDEQQSARGDEDRLYMMVRLRDQHDLYHVVTGYGRDVRGELAVLAFTAAQTRNPGVAAIPGYLLFRAGWRSELGALIRQGFRRGLRAGWLPAQHWEELLDQPLDEVRARLGLDDVPAYEAIRSAGAPALPQSA